MDTKKTSDMERLTSLIIGVLLIVFSASAQDSLKMYNVIDVDVIKPSHDDKAKAIPSQIAELEVEKEKVCERIKDYRSNFKTFKRSDIFMSSTGYYKPTVILGLREMQVLTDRFSERVELQIGYVLTVKNLNYSLTSKYMKQLYQMMDEVQSEYNQATKLYRQRVTYNY